MGSTYDRLRRADAIRQRKAERRRAPGPRRYKVLTIANNKGGVGKTTLALNLAVYLRARREDWPVLVVNLDDQDTMDRALTLGERRHRIDILRAARDRRLDRSICPGQFGLQYVPATQDLEALAAAWPGGDGLDLLLQASGFEGLVIVDTKSDLGPVTRSALAASDRVLVPVKDLGSLREAERLFAMLTEWGRPVAHARVLFSLIDLRVKVKADGNSVDVLALLLRELRERRWPNLPTFLSRSAAVEALANHPDGRPRTVLHGAPRSVVHRQFRSLADEVIEMIDAIESVPTAAPEPIEVLANGKREPSPPPATAPDATTEAAPARSFARWRFGRGGAKDPL